MEKQTKLVTNNILNNVSPQRIKKKHRLPWEQIAGERAFTYKTANNQKKETFVKMEKIKGKRQHNRTFF